MAVPRVVTVGGGHGQAALVSALVPLKCSITAIVSVADDGGCSGRLREEIGMAPPGDIRRCLVALATRPKLAARFDERSDERSAGNLVLAELWRELGSLQQAVDWAARMLGCVGRVVPVAETPGVLTAYDLERGMLAGESTIERESARAIAVNVDGPEHASLEAKRAIRDASLVFIGPGSFVGSTLAALTTGDLAAAIVKSRARRVLVQNLAREADAQYGIDQHERILRDHLVIKSGGEAVSLDVLAHDDAGVRTQSRADGSFELFARLRHPDGKAHDVALLSAALAEHFDLAPASRGPFSDDMAAERRFEETLAAARSRLKP